MRLTFYGGEVVFFPIILPPMISIIISKLNILFIGALFGPAMTKWYQFLNRIRFPSPTKALIYRVSIRFPFVTGTYITNIIFLVHSFGLTKLSSHQVGFFLFSKIISVFKPTYFLVAVAFFYSSMSVLEGKPEEAISRVKAVRH